DDFVKKHLGRKKGILSVFKAVIFGVPMPLCSCGVIPAALGVKKQGAGDGAALGFLISTPQTGIDSIMVSASMLGLPFAIFKVFSAFFLGLLGGSWAYFVDSRDANAQSSEVAPSTPTTTEKRGLRDMFEFAVDDLLAGIWKWLLAGVLVSAAITTWLPENFFRDYLPESDLAAMLLVLLISLPMYVCATASVPIAASLVYAGMPTGAALVFLMAGPASNVATIGAVYHAFGMKKVLIYLTSIIVGSIFFGMLFQSVLPLDMTRIPLAAAKHDHGVVEFVAALLLSGLMIRFVIINMRSKFREFRGKRVAISQSELETVTITVEEMTCEGCAGKVKAALLSVDGVSSVETD
ncbi:MAG: permease, partial [Victivallales bacterium]|nr:permease [Victivallales bacterium]